VRPPFGHLLVAPLAASVLAVLWVGLRRLLAGPWSVRAGATVVRRRWWAGFALAFGLTLFLEILTRLAKPSPPGEETLMWIVVGVFDTLAAVAWFPVIAMQVGDEVRFDEERVERRHPLRRTAAAALGDVTVMDLRASARTQIRTLLLRSPAGLLRLDVSTLSAPLAARILSTVPPRVVEDSRLRPLLLTIAQPDRFSWDGRDRIGYAPDGSQDQFPADAPFVDDD
jgi:hypothetical protein